MIVMLTTAGGTGAIISHWLLAVGAANHGTGGGRNWLSIFDRIGLAAAARPWLLTAWPRQETADRIGQILI